MSEPQRTPLALTVAKNVTTILVLLFIFLLGVKGLGGGFKMLGKDLLDSFFAATENPFFGLVVGVLATTLVQSSSVTTSMIVAMCAAPDNPLPIAHAVPMIMGANIGTTVTNTIVSLAHMGRRDEFLRAFSVATCHDFFNYISVLVLLPLELTTGLLSKSSAWLSHAVTGVGGFKYESPLKSILKTGLTPIKGLAGWLFDTPTYQALAVIVLSALLIFVALFLLVKVMRAAMSTRVETALHRVLGSNAVVSIVVGAAITVMVQSSSITTSILVPLAGAGLLTLRQAFPITLGANIGTTITALLASLAVSGANAEAGVTIALVHLLFNIMGILIIYPTPAIRRIPLWAAEKLASVAVKSRKWAILYVVGLFYGIPAALIFINKLLER